MGALFIIGGLLMELSNLDIFHSNDALGGLADEKIKGKLKFKLYKNKAKLEDAFMVLQKSLEGVDDTSEEEEILEESQNVEIDPFTLEELESLPLSMRDIGRLRSIIDFEEGDDK